MLVMSSPRQQKQPVHLVTTCLALLLLLPLLFWVTSTATTSSIGYHHCNNNNQNNTTATTSRSSRRSMRATLPLQQPSLQPQPRRQLGLLFLRTTLCVDKCQSQCRQYQTPMMICFHGASMFPDDPSWNSTTAVDILDTPMNLTHFMREFYNHPRDDDNHDTTGSNDNGSTTTRTTWTATATQRQQQQQEEERQQQVGCQGIPTDVFILPYKTCVGPFGAPRPWGTFHPVVVD